MDYGLFYYPGFVSLSSYSDSDWAGDESTYQSTQGYVFMINGGAVSWNSSLQSLITLSSTEAEYLGACNAACEAVWLRIVLKELRLRQRGPTRIHVDNESCIALSKNAVFHKRTKHIPLKYHKVREFVAKMVIELEPVQTYLQATDMFTKAVELKQLKMCRDLISLSSVISQPSMAQEGDC